MAFLTFAADVILAMGGGLLHFRLYCPFPNSWYSQLWFLSRSQGVLVSPALPSVGLGFLRWTVSLHLSPLLAFADERGGPGVLAFHRSCCSQFPSSSFRLAGPFVPEGNFVTWFLFIFSLYLILCNGFCCLPSFLYRIAAAWLLHVWISAG